MHKATHIGKLKIADKTLNCGVLEDGTRILFETSIANALGRSGNQIMAKKEAKESGSALPVFLATRNLNDYIDNDLRKDLLKPIPFKVDGKIWHGFRADLLPRICEVYLNARDDDALHKRQLPKAKQAEILLRALAHVGITALVDEATGYQADRARDALERILEEFITKELRKWTKTFPDEFYRELFRLRGWKYLPFEVKRPSQVGRDTNDLVYERLAPNVLEELQRVNPKLPTGNRRWKHHQWLTEDIGHPALRQHLASVITLMRISTDWGKFKRHIERALPKKNAQLPLPGTDDEE